MIQIEQVAQAALKGDGLLARSLTQDFFRENHRLADIPKPTTDDPRILAASASLIELFSMRLMQDAPMWTQSIGPVAEPIYFLKAATRMKHLRALCETESPAPLRKRKFYAPPNYLEFA